MTETNMPRLRFRGFDGEWKNDLLENKVNFVQGNDGSDNRLPVLTISAGKGWMNQKDRFGTVLAGKELKKYTLLKKGQLSYNHGNYKLAKYGTVFCLRNYDKALVPRVYHSFELKNGDSNFLEKLFESKIPDRQLRKLITSGARMDGLLNINKKAFGSISLNFPTQYEQQKIGSFFAKMDNLIELQSQKLGHLKTLKKGYLQKMFPQDGETLPRLRFSGFSDDWKEDILDNLLHECEKNEVINPEKYKTLKVSLHFKGVQATNDHPRATSKGRKYYVRRPGELIIGKQNFHNGGFAIIPDDVDGYVASSAIVSFTNKSNCNLKWIDYYMMNSDWLRRTTVFIGGTGQKEYSVKTLKSLKLKVPSIEEQQKISEFFSKLDQLINNQTKKIEALKQQKKAYLQKMFI